MKEQKRIQIMMNKISKKISLLLLGAVLTTNAANAQKSALRSVGVSLSQVANSPDVIDYLIEAKNDIDRAALNEKTKNDPRMYLYKSMVYSRLFFKKGSEIFSGADLSTVGYESALAMQNFLKYTGEKNSEDVNEARLEVTNAFVSIYNESNSLVEKQAYGKLVEYMQISSFLYDNLDTSGIRQLGNNGIDGKSVNYRLMYFATKLEDKKQQEDIFTSAIKSGKGGAIAYEGLANLYLSQKDTAKAETMLSDAFKKNTKNKDIFNVLKNFYIVSGKTDKLLKVVDNLIKEDDGNSAYYYLRGKLRDDVEKNHDAAKSDYLKAIELDDFNYDAYFDLGANLLNYGTQEWRNKKATARSSEEIKAANEGLTKVYKQAEKYLLRANDNRDYTAADKLNLYQSLYIVYLELEDQGKAQYYKNLKEYQKKLLESNKN